MATLLKLGGELLDDATAVRTAAEAIVRLASATPVYPDKPASAPGVEYIPVRLSTGPNPLDVPDPNGRPWPRCPASPAAWR